MKLSYLVLAALLVSGSSAFAGVGGYRCGDGTGLKVRFSEDISGVLDSNAEMYVLLSNGKEDLRALLPTNPTGNYSKQYWTDKSTYGRNGELKVAYNGPNGTIKINVKRKTNRSLVGKWFISIKDQSGKQISRDGSANCTYIDP